MFNPIDYIKGIVESLTFTQSISNIIIGATETTFDTCKTFWVFPKYKITINGVKYMVKDFEINKSITITGVLTGNETEFEIDAPHFIHGTPLQTSNALIMVKNWRQKLPLVYLIEPMKKVTNYEPLEKIGITASLKMLFMLPGKIEDAVDKQYLTAIEPTQNLIFEWERKILTDSNIGELGSSTSHNRVNYGVWVSTSKKPKPSMKDNIQKLIDLEISGVEFEIEIPFKKIICGIDKQCRDF